MDLKIKNIYCWLYIVIPLWSLFPSLWFESSGGIVTSLLFMPLLCFEERFQDTKIYTAQHSETCLFCRAWDLGSLINSWIFNDWNIREEDTSFIFLLHQLICRGADFFLQIYKGKRQVTEMAQKSQKGKIAKLNRKSCICIRRSKL